MKTAGHTVSFAQLPAFCEKLSVQFAQRQLILLSGPLGAGKTQFVKSCVSHLGGEMPDSPTFSLINEYSGASMPIWHVDLYRLENETDVESTGFWDLFREPKGLIFVEWPEKVDASSWPLTWSKIHVQIAFDKNPDERLFTII